MEKLNAKITNVSLNMRNHGVLSFDITLEGAGWGCVYGGYCLGNSNTEPRKQSRSIECLMQIMDIIGVDAWEDLKGKYCRVLVGGIGDPVKVIGNIWMINGLI